MTDPQPLLLLNGYSGVGKSTLIRKVATALTGQNIRGFVSEVIMTDGKRMGWRLETLDGRGGVLAHRDIRSQHLLETRDGNYGVDLALMEELTRSELRPENVAALYMIDEIARIGLWSPVFTGAVRALLDAGRPVIAVVHLYHPGFVQEVRSRSGAVVWDITPENREEMYGKVLAWAQAVLNK